MVYLQLKKERKKKKKRGVGEEEKFLVAMKIANQKYGIRYKMNEYYIES